MAFLKIFTKLWLSDSIVFQLDNFGTVPSKNVSFSHECLYPYDVNSGNFIAHEDVPPFQKLGPSKRFVPKTAMERRP